MLPRWAPSACAPGAALLPNYCRSERHAPTTNTSFATSAASLLVRSRPLQDAVASRSYSSCQARNTQAGCNPYHRHVLTRGRFHISQGVDRDPRTFKISLLRPVAVSSCQIDGSVVSSIRKRLCKAIYFLTRAQGRRTCADGRRSARVAIAGYLFGPKPKGPPCGFGGAPSQTNWMSSGTKLDTLSNMPFSVLRCGDVSGYGLRSSGHVRFFSRTGHVVRQRAGIQDKYIATPQ